jgi:hypothetical protein
MSTNECRDVFNAAVNGRMYTERWYSPYVLMYITVLSRLS